ncbi:glycosyltransferase family 2 protein [Dysgonomonas sp.]
MLDLSVIILTYNEELHIRRCIENVKDIVKEIFIIDSFSTDKTLQIAKEYPQVTVLQNKWENSHAKQFNWGLHNAPIQTKWILKLDADEYLTEDLKTELTERLASLSETYTGVIFPLRRVFLGRTIRRGMSQVKLLRLFQYGKAQSEVRLMDEHIQLLEGQPIEFKHEFADDNLNNLSWWTQKHIGYAIREAADLLNLEYYLSDTYNGELGKQASEKRQKKMKYAKQPLFWRSFAYFCYRYFFRMGLLEGEEGFLWHFLQGWWYRTLVDAKVYEIRKECGKDKEKVRTLLAEKYQIKVD